MLNVRFIGLLLVVVASAAMSKPEYFPATSPDGLQLVPNDQVRAVYVKQGVDLQHYDKIELLPTHVAFVSDWLAEQNEQAIAQNRVSDKEMQGLRDKVASEFNREMLNVLSREGGRQIVSGGGTGVLVLRPSLINLDITMPDLSVPGMNRGLQVSAVRMTLNLELYDGRTGEIVARIYDTEGTGDGAARENTDKEAVIADFDRIVQHWAQVVSDHLTRLSGRE